MIKPNNLPLITIVIPTYERSILLKRAIKSVLNQTFTNFQICIYDNASNDNTKKIVEEFSQKDSKKMKIRKFPDFTPILFLLNL